MGGQHVEHLIVGAGFADLQRRMRRTGWPKATYTFRRRLARFDPDAYDVRREETAA